MANLIVALVIGLIVGAAAGYVYISKKRGAKCVGCPHSGSCRGGCCGK